MSKTKRKKTGTNNPSPPGAMNFAEPAEKKPPEETSPAEPIKEETPPEEAPKETPAEPIKEETPPEEAPEEIPAEPIKEETPPEEAPEETPAEPIKEETPPEPVEKKPARGVSVACPLAELGGDGNFANPAQGHVQALLDRRQALAINRLFKGLDDTGARLANGRRIGSKADAVRWLLEQLSE